jgi:hypothetical protein
VVFSLSFKYALLVFIGVMGVLQAAASYNDLRGVLFFKNKNIGYIFAVLAIGGSLVSFFTWNYVYETGVIQGSEQAGLFAMATAVAFIFTLLLSSAIKYAQLKSQEKHPRGLDALKTATILQLFLDIFNGKGS